MRPRLLDAFCCQGAASKGYIDAGFDVVGIDIDPQPRYPYTFELGDAVQYIRDHGHEYDAIHASPPCQAYSKAQRIQNRQHPDLISETRSALLVAGRPYVIENVEDARGELRNPVRLQAEELTAQHRRGTGSSRPASTSSSRCTSDTRNAP
jgi:DNA (cytosine-5)-methyltransferase 1